MIGVVAGSALLSVSILTPNVLAEGDETPPEPPSESPPVEEPSADEPPAAEPPPTTVVVAVGTPPIPPATDDDGNAVAVGAPPVPPATDDDGNAVAVGRPPVSSGGAVQPATLVNRPVVQITSTRVVADAVHDVASRLDELTALL